MAMARQSQVVSPVPEVKEVWSNDSVFAGAVWARLLWKEDVEPPVAIFWANRLHNVMQFLRKWMQN